MDPVQPDSNDDVSKIEDEIPETKQGDWVDSEQTENLQSHDNDECANVEADNSEIIDNGTGGDEQKVDLAQYWPLWMAVQKNEWEGVENFMKNQKGLTTNITKLVSHKDDGSLNVEEISASEDHNVDLRYWPLWRAVQENDWKAVEDFIKENPDGLPEKIKKMGSESLNAEVKIDVVLDQNGSTMDPLQAAPDDSARGNDEFTEMEEGEPSEEETEKLDDQDDEQVDEEEIKENTTSEENKDHVRFQPLFKALLEKDWKGLEDFIREDLKPLSAKIKVYEEETIFDIIARDLDVPFWLLENLVSMVASESLEQSISEYGFSSIFIAAVYGNKKAAEAFVRMNKDLPNKKDSEGFLPIHKAAERGHKEITQYLLSVTTIPLDDEKGVILLQDLIKYGLYGIALDLLKQYPKLAREKIDDRKSILVILASKPQAFESGSRLGYWKRLICKWIPEQDEPILHPQRLVGDVESSIEESKKNKFRHFAYILQKISTALDAVSQKLKIMFWNALMQLVPGIKGIRDTKLMHMHTLEIVRIMCHEGVTWSHTDALLSESLVLPFLTAVRWGIWEIVNEILKAYFYSYTFYENNGHGILHLAILHRQEKVFSLVNKMNLFVSRWKAACKVEQQEENILHLAGKLVLSSQVPGAALQMQRELQWFKAVENYVHPSLQEQQNKSHKTPREVFTEEHKNLVKEGEKWMKETASSCTVVAALIITVVFAAAFTVPGGNDCSNGIPIFLHKPAFLVFVISDAFALFCSTASLLMFLGILTSRYSEEDFLVSLPKKLIIGLITMFFSIAGMMVAFGATLYIFLSHSWRWTIVPISLLGCLPVTLFALLQFPLLVEIYSSTYRTSLIKPRE